MHSYVVVFIYDKAKGAADKNDDFNGKYEKGSFTPRESNVVQEWVSVTFKVLFTQHW